MTFGNFALRVRKRLQDSYKPDGTAITLISENGLRWSSSELIEICSGAISKLTRFMKIYDVAPIFKTMGNDNLATTATVITVTTTGISESLPNTVLIVLSVSDSESGYEYITPDKYQDFLKEENKPPVDGKYYTIMWDVTAKAKKIFIIPKGSAVTLNYEFVYYFSSYGLTDTDTEVHIIGLDDVLLDIAEMEGRDREHNWDRSLILNKRILLAFGIKEN